jgi:ABC-2 type transport system permease protein
MTTIAPSPRAVAPTTLVDDIRAIKIVCHRELLRWVNDRGRLLGGLIQPMLFLFVLGTGLSSVVSTGIPGVDFRTFIFPGVLAMSVLFTGVFSGVSIVWDREFGFLREMLVAPIRRSSIILGKCLGGAIVATAQGSIVLAFAGLVDVPYDPVMLLELLGILFLVAMSVTALGMFLAAKISDMQALMPIIQVVITPMMFLSGALYPISGLPTWLLLLTKINPLTYAVQPMRYVVLTATGLSGEQANAFDPPVTWFGWPVPIPVQLLFLAFLGAITLAAAVKRFSAVD